MIRRYCRDVPITAPIPETVIYDFLDGRYVPKIFKPERESYDKNCVSYLIGANLQPPSFGPSEPDPLESSLVLEQDCSALLNALEQVSSVRGDSKEKIDSTEKVNNNNNEQKVKD